MYAGLYPYSERERYVVCAVQVDEAQCVICACLCWVDQYGIWLYICT